MGRRLYAAVMGTVLLMLPAFLAGCRTFTDPARSHSLGKGVYWMDYDATRRGALLVPQDTKYRVLSEPSPDAALGVVSEFVAKTSYSGISGEGSAKVTESIAELGKRTQTIMFLREALFRLNEMDTLNKELTREDLKELYERVLDVSLKLAEADRQKAEADKFRAETDAISIRTLINPSVDDAPLRAELKQLLTKSPNDENKAKYPSTEALADAIAGRISPGATYTDVMIRGGPNLRQLVDELKKGVK